MVFDVLRVTRETANRGFGSCAYARLRTCRIVPLLTNATCPGHATRQQWKSWPLETALNSLGDGHARIRPSGLHCNGRAVAFRSA